MIFNKVKSTIIIQITIITILGFVGYANSLRGGFIYDDLILVKDNAYIKTLDHIPDIMIKNMGAGALAEMNFYRPVQMISYVFDYALWKLDVTGYHLTNILLHILVTIVIYWLINILYGNSTLSFFTSALFIIHPAHTEAVAYISSRADLLSALFILLCIVFYIKQVSIKSATLYLMISFSYAFALLSKEYGLVVPALLLAYSYVFRKKLLIREFLTILGTTFIYFILRMTVLRFVLVSEIPATTLFQRVPGFFVSITEYLRILLLPFNLHMEYGTRIFSFYDPKALMGAAILFASLAFAFIKKESYNLLSFSIFWFLAAMLPMSNLYPINAYMAEHWLYVPSIGFFLMFANSFILLINKAKGPRLIFISLLISILFFYSYLTIRQNNYWRDPIVFYKTTLKYVPNNERMYTNMGFVYFSMGKIKESFAAFNKLLEINPSNAGAYNGLGNVYDETGEREKAIAMFKKAITLEPRFVYTYYNLAKVFLATGKIEEAMALYNKAIEIDPNATEAYYSLGRIYKDNKEKALAMFKQAIVADPDYLQAYIELGKIYNSTGKTEEMISLYKKAVMRHLEYFDAYYAMGNIYYDIEKYKEAIPLYKKAAEIRPNSAEAYLGLGNSYCAIGRNKAAIRFFKKTIELNPNFGLAYNNLAVAYYYSKQYALAIKYCDKAAELGYEVKPKFLESVKPYRK